MARYNTLKAAIAAAIKTNGQQQITGQSLQTQLLNMVTALGKYFQSYGGLVTPTDSFTAGDESVLFFATEAGTYTDFGGVTLDGKSLHILYWDGSWHDEDTRVPVAAMLDEKADKEGVSPALVAGSAQGLVGVAETSMEFLRAALPESAGTGAAMLKAVKGKSIVWNQLVAPDATEVATISGHNYLTHIGGVDAIVTSTGAAIAISDASADNVHDLTLLALGDLTIAQFRALFPRTDYAYNPGEVLPFAGERLESEDEDENTIGSITLNPATIKDKDGNLVFPYGGMHGKGTAFDALTGLVNGFFTKGKPTMKKVNLGDLNWSLSASAPNVFVSDDIPDKIVQAEGALQNLICGRYVSESVVTLAANLQDKHITGNANGDKVVVKDSAYTDAAAFKAAMQGVELVFELATPVEVELAEPIPATLPVQQGGTLAVLPENTDEPYTAPASIVAKFPLGTSSIISKGTLTNLLEALKTAGVITAYTMTYDASTGDYTFTITKEDAVTISEGE